MSVPAVGEWQTKVWGRTRCLFDDGTHESHMIEVQRYGYCSIHRHAHKWNRFYVHRGCLLIRRSAVGSDELDLFGCLLSAGQSIDIPPGVWHQFEATELPGHGEHHLRAPAPPSPWATAIEEYWVELGQDIERKSEGGLREAGHDALRRGNFLPRKEYFPAMA